MRTALVAWLGTRAPLAGPLLFVACANLLVTGALLTVVLSRAWDAWSLLLACTAAEVLAFGLGQLVIRARGPLGAER